jgi:hypothetical protein
VSHGTFRYIYLYVNAVANSVVKNFRSVPDVEMIHCQAVVLSLHVCRSNGIFTPVEHFVKYSKSVHFCVMYERQY